MSEENTDVITYEDLLVENKQLKEENERLRNELIALRERIERQAKGILTILHS